MSRTASLATLDGLQAAIDRLRADVAALPDEPAKAGLVTPKQLAHDFGVHERTARRWARKYGHKVRGRWLIDSSTIPRAQGGT